MTHNFGRENVEAKLKDLFLLSSKGDQTAYEDFLNLTSALVKRYLHYLAPRQADHENLEDLHQEIMMSVHLKKHTYRTDYPILPWVYAIARYRYIDYYRMKKKRPLHVEFEELHGVVNHCEYILDFSEILNSLSPRQREMLELVKIEGMSYADAAVNLEMSVTSLKVAVHRIIKSLKEKGRK
jgi:RNA polymerase sigma-70 factor (ECF subfamily)